MIPRNVIDTFLIPWCLTSSQKAEVSPQIDIKLLSLPFLNEVDKHLPIKKIIWTVLQHMNTSHTFNGFVHVQSALFYNNSLSTGIYYMIWRLYQRIKGVSATYGDHWILKSYDLLRKYQEGTEPPRKHPSTTEVVVTWHENARWLVNTRIPLVTSHAMLFLSHDHFRHTLGHPCHLQL